MGGPPFMSMCTSIGAALGPPERRLDISSFRVPLKFGGKLQVDIKIKAGNLKLLLTVADQSSSVRIFRAKASSSAGLRIYTICCPSPAFFTGLKYLVIRLELGVSGVVVLAFVFTGVLGVVVTGFELSVVLPDKSIHSGSFRFFASMPHVGL